MPVLSYEDAVAAGDAAERPAVLSERHGRIAVIRLHNPETRNAFNAAQTLQLRKLTAELCRDHDVTSVVITGSSPGFSSGGDLGLMQDAVRPIVDGPEGASGLWRWIRHEYGAIVTSIVESEKVFLAAVNGPAVGVALGIVFACDLVIASERASFVPGFASIGLVPEAGVSWVLTRRLGYHGAFDLLTSGAPLGAHEAMRRNLVSAVVPEDELLDVALERCAALEALPAPAVRLTKRVLRNAADASWHQAIAIEEFAQPLCFSSAAHQEMVEQLLDDRLAT